MDTRWSHAPSTLVVHSTQRTEKKNTKMSRRANTITNFISKYGKLLWCYMWYLRMTKTSFVGSLTSEIIVKKKNTTTQRHTIEGRLSPPSARHTARNRRRKKTRKKNELREFFASCPHYSSVVSCRRRLWAERVDQIWEKRSRRRQQCAHTDEVIGYLNND